MNNDGNNPLENGSEIMKTMTESMVNVTKILDYFRNSFGIGPSVIEAYKKILNDYINSSQHTPEEKLCFAATYKQKIRKLQNCQNVIDDAVKDCEVNADPSKVDADWFTFFFEKVKNISNESLRLVLSNILKTEINQPDTVSKTLIQTLSIISRKQLEIFCEVSRFCWDEYQSDLTHLFVFVADEPKAYADSLITWEKLKELERLGLVICDSTVGFALEGNRTFRKGQIVVEVTADKNGAIPTGNVKFTDDGKTLYDFLDRELIKTYRADIFDFLINELNKKGCSTWVRR